MRATVIITRITMRSITTTVGDPSSSNNLAAFAPHCGVFAAGW
jgi:hypothetical protein